MSTEMRITPAFKLASIVMLAVMLFASLPGCTCGTQSAVSIPAQIVTAKIQDLAITIPVDGHLIMPEAYDLHFGTSGDVKEVLVSEGDLVREGQILAKLDDTAQRLDIKASNNSVQQTLSNLYETVPRLPQFPTKFWDADATTVTTPASTSTVTTNYPDTIDTTTTETVWLPDSGPVPPPSGPTTVTDTTYTELNPSPNVTIKLIETHTTTTTVTVAPGPTVSTPPSTEPTHLVTTTKVKVISSSKEITTTIPATTITTYTLIERPQWDYKWDEAQNDWIRNPNIPENTTLPIGYPGYYANPTALTACNWAGEEVDNAVSLFASGNLTAASSELYVAMADLEACLLILEDAMLNPDSGVGNWAPHVPDDVSMLVDMGYAIDQPFAAYYVMEIREAISDIRQAQADIGKLRSMISQCNYNEAGNLFNTLITRMQSVSSTAINNINVIEKRSDTDIYGREISFKLYDAAAAKLNAALKGIEDGGLESPGLSDNLRIAEHYIRLCNGILGTNDYVLQHGLSLKAENQYKVDLAKAVIELNNKRDDFLKTVIMSPVDGMVVSVAVKENDVLSAQDYSSKGTIQMVDTSQIKFSGTVDEIDILKVRTGQEAAIEVDAFPGHRFKGIVTFISPYGTSTSGGVVKFDITIKLQTPDIDLKGGLTATAKLAVETIESALTVPLTAISSDEKGSFVNIVTDNATGHTEQRYVTLGAENDTYVQIVSGLNKGDQVQLIQRAAGLTTNTMMRPSSGGGPPAGHP